MNTAVKKLVTIDLSKMSGDQTGTRRYLSALMAESFATYFEKHDIDLGYFGHVNFEAIDPHRGGDALKLLKRATLPNPYNKPGFVVSVYTEGTQGIKGFLTATNHQGALQALIYEGTKPKKAALKASKPAQTELENIPQIVPPASQKSQPKNNPDNNEVPLMTKIAELRKLTERLTVERSTLKDEIANIEESIPHLEKQVRDWGEVILDAQAKQEKASTELTRARSALQEKQEKLSRVAVPKETQDEIKKLYEQATELARMAGITQ